MSTRAGTSLIETLLAMSLLVGILTAGAALYSFTMRNVASEAAQNACTLQANSLAEELSKTIGEATSCSIITSGSSVALRCAMPDTGGDANGDGVIDVGAPTTVVGSGGEVYTPGIYVWYYMADATGAWGTTGTQLWRAKVASTGAPTSSDLDRSWSKYYGGASRWSFIDSVSFTVDATYKTTSFTINASALNRADRSGAAETAANMKSVLSLTRLVFWRNYR